jgi:hypothetical protein
VVSKPALGCGNIADSSMAVKAGAAALASGP